MLHEIQKTALITGSGVRLGKHVAQMLAKNAWNIAIHYNNSEKEAYSLAKELLPFASVMLFQADLQDIEQVKKLFDQVNNQIGSVNLLINNASIYKNDEISNLNEALLESCLALHIKAPLLLAKEFALQTDDGDIINILDSDISKNLKKFFSYSISKKALFDLTKMLAVSLAPNVRVNAIAPGAILFKEGQNKKIFDEFIKSSPLAKKPSLEELEKTIKFLLDVRSITGQCIFLDGGKHLV